MLAQLIAFKTGARDGTIMPQLMKGYTDEQLQIIASVLGKNNEDANMNRRLFLGQSSALLSLMIGGQTLARASDLISAEIVVVGAGYGGATTAKYIRLLSNNTARVTLIEPDPFLSHAPCQI